MNAHEFLQQHWGMPMWGFDNLNKQGGIKMTEQQNWLDKELESSTSPSPYEKRPALKLQPNKVIELEVDFSQQFYKWEDKIHKSVKAIIPVMVNGEKMNFWLNVKNPLYRQICEKGKAGLKTIKVVQTGSQADTKYNLVE